MVSSKRIAQRNAKKEQLAQNGFGLKGTIEQRTPMLNGLVKFLVQMMP
jgi:hypothetical protein